MAGIRVLWLNIAAVWPWTWGSASADSLSSPSMASREAMPRLA